MFSQETQCGETSITPDAQFLIDTILNSEGFCRNTLYAPISTLLDLLKILLNNKKIKKTRIQHKLASFCNYLICHKEAIVDKTLDSAISHMSQTVIDLNNPDLFFSSQLLLLSAYLFSVRIELYYIGEHNKLSCQYFGLKPQAVKCVFLHENSFIVLNKILPKSDTFSTKLYSDINSVHKKKLNKLEALKLGAYDPINMEIARNEVIKNNLHRGKVNNQMAEKFESPLTENFSKSINQKFSSSPSNETSTQSSFQCNLGEITHNTLNNYNLLDCKKNTVYKQYFNTTVPLNPLELNSVNSNHNSDQYEQCNISHQFHYESSIGRLKFYNEIKEYGFIIMDDGSEIFVHKADLAKQNIDTRYLTQYKKYYEIFLNFDIQEYQGKTQMHRKAINIVLHEMQPIF